jgi:hypothetical protein
MLRSFMSVLFAIVIAATTYAQEPLPARFFIERIEVRNTKRVSADLVKSESLIREGAEYAESDLSAAAARLTRLPFLLSADFALERGSDRGRHVLVITVQETKPFFFLIDARPTLWDDSRRTIDYDVDPAMDSQDAAAGFRWFVGGRGIVHVGTSTRRDRQAFTTDFSTFAVGYTHYDLFGTGAFATMNLRLPFDSPAEGRISPQFVVGMPLTPTQTVTLNFEDTFFRRDTVRLLGTEFDRQDAERVLSLTWSYNSTNQPFVPTRGTILRVSPLLSMRDRSGYRFVRPIPDPMPAAAYAQHVNGHGVDLTAVRYWELSERNSVSAGVMGGWASVEDRIDPPVGRGDIRWDPTYGILRAGYSRSFWRGDTKDGDSRIEFDARFVARQRNVEQGREAFGATPDDENTFQTSASWVRRSAWGTLRLGAGYSWGH